VLVGALVQRTLVLSADPQLTVNVVKDFFTSKTSFELESVTATPEGSINLVFKDEIQVDIAAAQQPFMIGGVPRTVSFLS